MANDPLIVLVNAWHDDNKGDSSICEATLLLIRKQWPTAKLGLVSIISNKSGAFEGAYRHLLKTFPDLEIAASPIDFYDPISGQYSDLLLKFPISLLRLFPFLGMRHLEHSHPINLISKADLIVSNGGHYIYTHPSTIKSVGRLFRMTYPLLVAFSYKVPYVIFSQSLGPFNDFWGNQLIKFIFDNSMKISPREELSHKNLLDIGISNSKISVVPDSAFALKPLMTDNVQKVLSKHCLTKKSFWVVTVRKSPNGSEQERQARTEKFLDEVALTARRVLQLKLTDKVALVVHTQGPTLLEDDSFVTRALAQRLGDCKNVVLVEEDLSPRELAAFYGHASFLVGTRFHSVIFSLISGTPAFAISYSGPKTWGIMTDLGMEELCSDLENFSSEAFLNKVENLDFASQEKEINEKIITLRQQLDTAIAEIKDLL